MSATIPGTPPLVEQLKGGLDAPICLTWELTYACNLACVHCLSSSGRRDPDELTTAEAMSVVDQLAALLAVEPFAGAPEGPDRIVVHLATPPDPAAVGEALDVEGLELCALHGADVCVLRHGRAHPMPALEVIGAIATSRSVRTLAGLVRRATA